MKDDIQLALDFAPNEIDLARNHIERFIEIHHGTSLGDDLRIRYNRLIRSQKDISEEVFKDQLNALYEEVCEAVF